MEAAAADRPIPGFKRDMWGDLKPLMVGVDVLFDGAWHPVGLLPQSEAVSRYGHRIDKDIRFSKAF